jgi:hypothetical protein
MALSGTRAMMAATRLQTSAIANDKAADGIEDASPGAAENLRELGRWYREVADALLLLDQDGTPITRLER